MPQVIAVIAAKITVALVGIGSVGLTATVYVATQAVLYAAISIGLRKLVGPDDIPQTEADKTRTENVVRGGTQPRTIVYGRQLVGGVLAYANTGGTDNKDLWFTIAHAGHPIEEINDFWFDSARLGIANVTIGGGVTGGLYYLAETSTPYVYTYANYGTTTQTAITPYVNTFTDITTDHRGRGIAYSVIRLVLAEASQKVFERGAPRNIRALMQGKNNIYDPRLDTSAGANPTNATYQAYTRNPILCVVDYMRDTQIGMGISDARIDWTTVVNESNFCDQQVPNTVDGSSDERFTCNGVMLTSDTHSNNIKKILSSCNGQMAYKNGKFFIKAGRIGTGANLVTNPSFATGIIGWTTSGTVAWDASFRAIKIENGARASQGITTVVGNVYHLKVRIGDAVLVGGTVSTQIKLAAANSADGTGELVSQTNTTENSVAEFTFIATAGTTYIVLSNGGPIGSTAVFDDVEQYLVSSTAVDGSWLRGDISMQTATPKAQRFNTVRAFYRNSNNNYKEAEALKVTNTAFVTRDNGEELYEDIDLPFTSNETEAQRVAHKLIQATDQQTVVTMPCNYKALKISVHDRLTLTIPELSWTDKLFRVIDWKLNGEDEGVDVVLREDSADAWEDPDQADYSTRTAAGVVTEGTPEVPVATSVTLTARTDMPDITIDWVNPTVNAYWGFAQVWRGTSNSFGAATRIWTGRTNSYTDSNATAGVAYYYWVRMQQGATYSTEAASTPTNSTAAAIAASTATNVNWSGVVDDDDGKRRVVGGVFDIQDESGGTITLETGDILDLNTVTDLGVPIYNIDISVAAVETSLTTVINQVSGLEQTIVDLTSGVSDVYVSATAPVAGVDGVADPIPEFSRWYESDNDNHPYYWNSTAWVSLADARIGQNQSDIVSLETVAYDAVTGVVATSTALGVLDATVVGQGSSITTNASSITSLSVGLFRLQDENGAILLTEADVEVEAESLSDAGAGSAAATQTLEARVIVNENTTNVTVTDLVELTATVGGKATITSVNGVQGNLDDTNGILNAEVINIDNIELALNDATTGLANTYAITAASAITLNGTGGVVEDLAAVNLKYGVTIDDDGNLSGFELISGGGVSTFSILADTFQIVDPAAPAGGGVSAPFTVTGGVVTMQNVNIAGNLLVGGSVTATEIATNAITTGKINNGAVDWSTKIGGTGKPSDNATVNTGPLYSDSFSLSANLTAAALPIITWQQDRDGSTPVTLNSGQSFTFDDAGTYLITVLLHLSYDINTDTGGSGIPSVGIFQLYTRYASNGSSYAAATNYQYHDFVKPVSTVTTAVTGFASMPLTFIQDAAAGSKLQLYFQGVGGAAAFSVSSASRVDILQLKQVADV